MVGQQLPCFGCGFPAFCEETVKVQSGEIGYSAETAVAKRGASLGRLLKHVMRSIMQQARGGCYAGEFGAVQRRQRATCILLPREAGLKSERHLSRAVECS